MLEYKAHLSLNHSQIHLWLLQLQTALDKHQENTHDDVAPPPEITVLLSYLLQHCLHRLLHFTCRLQWIGEN